MKTKIKDIFQKHQNILSTNFGQIAFLFVISLLVHGVFIPWLGLYGDDWSLLWLSYKAGSTTSFFPENRFLLPYIYSLFSSLLSPTAWEWHILFFLIRFFSVVNLWILLKEIWPTKKMLRVWISLLFSLYPGSLIIYQPITFWTVYLQFNFLFVSMWTMLAAIRNNNKRWFYMIVSMIFASLNLILTEYLYFLELLRIPILLMYFENNKIALKTKYKKIISTSIPFLILFFGFSIFRLVFHKDAGSYYHVDLGSYLSDPFHSIQYLIYKIFSDGFKSGLSAWIIPFSDSVLFNYSGLRSILLFSLVSCCFALMILFFTTFVKEEDQEKKISLISLLFGVIALIFVGVPFWIAGLPIDIGTANYSRFSIPAALGSAFLIYGIVTLIFRKRQLTNIILSIFCVSAIMMHLLAGNFFRKEWELQNRFLYQLAWRIPAVVPGTTFFANELPFWTLGENSISATINWIYMENNFPIDHIDYYFYYDEERFIGNFPQEKDIQFERSHLAGAFNGNSSNLITFWYQPPACLYIMNEPWDKYNPDIPGYLRSIAGAYSQELILPQGNSEMNLINSSIFLDEDTNDFCYYYEKASLAAANEQWDEVVDLWNSSVQNNLKPNYALERLPFIQGFAYENQYEESFSLSLEIIDNSKKHEPLVCEFWRELSQDNSLEVERINDYIKNKLTCE